MKTKKCKMLQSTKVILSAFVLCIFAIESCKSLASDNHETLSSKLYRQSWSQQDNFDASSTFDNEIVTNHQHQKRPATQTSGAKQQNYACGRAFATSKSKSKNNNNNINKYNDLMLLNSDQRQQQQQQQQQQSNGLRSTLKYRPFEIRTPRIIGGDETSPGEFPWAVSVKLNGQPICGGSLIDRSWILTAAHCVVGYNPKNLTVRLGAYRIKDMSEQQTIDTSISLFIVHKQYSMPRPFSNDIALLKVAEPIEFSDYIIPICLPTEDQVTTSLSSEIVNDYTKPLRSASDFSLDEAILLEDENDSAGIVVSTNMSDKEISRCFKRLEQNYLNSIGLASSASSTPAPLPVPLPLQASGALLEASAAPAQSAEQLYTGPTRVDSYSRPTAEFKRPNTKVTFLRPASSVAAEQHFETALNSYNQQNSNNRAKQRIYYEVPWNRMDGQQRAPAASREADGFALANQQQQQQLEPRQQLGRLSGNNEPPIKLTSLPISKDLLREIQSVGSMQSLTLGLLQNDIEAMAHDLSGGAEQTGNAATALALDRERVISSSSGSIRPQLVRTNAFDDQGQEPGSVDDPSKYSGMSGIVVGWGWVRENDNEDQQQHQQVGRGYQSVTLQKVRLPILRNSDCEAWFRSQEKKITLLPSQFCAGFNLGGKDACRGDSGGPMIIEDNSDTGRYKLIGIVSAGIGCARPSLPGLYTRVASFIPWINVQVARY